MDIPASNSDKSYNMTIHVGDDYLTIHIENKGKKKREVRKLYISSIKEADIFFQLLEEKYPVLKKAIKNKIESLDF